MVRFLVVLAIAAAVIVVFWPYLRKLDPSRQRSEAAAPRKGGTLFFAVVITLVLSFVLSTALWLMAR